MNCYNEEMLSLIVERDKIKITNRPENISNREDKISYICKCGNEIKKSIRYMNENGSYCSKCKPEKIETIFNDSKSINYNYELLLELSQKYGTKILSYPEKLKAYSEIHFKCICGENDEKFFRTIVKNYFLCKSCAKKLGSEKSKATNIKNHGVEHHSQRPEIKQKTRNTNIAKFGFPNPMQNEDIKNKQRQVLLDNHGVEHPSQSEELRNKARDTMTRLYGAATTMQSDILKEKVTATMIENGGWTLQRPESKEKYENTMSKNYGAKHPMLSPEIKKIIQDKFIDNYDSISPFGNKEIQEKSKTTNMLRYGVRNAMQNGEILEKQQRSSYKYKKYLLPDGKTIYLQGYEPYIYNLLLEDYHQDEIISGVNKVPIIKYIFENKVRVYFCDIFIPKENKIIEVKSKYTYEKEVERNILKKEACISEGYKFEFYIYDKKSKLLNIL